MTKIRITRTRIYGVIIFYILSYFACIFLLGAMADFYSVPINSIIFYYVITWVYLPISLFVMFLMDTSPSITIPGIISLICASYVLLRRIDFTVNLGDD